MNLWNYVGRNQLDVQTIGTHFLCISWAMPSDIYQLYRLYGPSLLTHLHLYHLPNHLHKPPVIRSIVMKFIIRSPKHIYIYMIHSIVRSLMKCSLHKMQPDSIYYTPSSSSAYIANNTALYWWCSSFKLAIVIIIIIIK